MSELLSQAGVSREVGWHDIIVVQSFRSSAVGAASALQSNFGGFNFVIVNRRKPEFFVKCRAAGNAALARETKVQSCLARSRPGNFLVPSVRAAESHRLVLQVSPFVQGSHYGRIVSKQSTEDYLATLRSILFGVADLSSFAQDNCPEIAIGESPLELHSSAEESLEYVARHAPLDDPLTQALSTTLSRTGPVPGRPQHGDLWYQNVLVTERSLWGIDWEHYASVRCPLYDDVALTRSTFQLRSRYRNGGIQGLLGPDPEAVACRRLLMARAESEGIDTGKIDGILAYSLLRWAATVNRRAGPSHGRRHLADVQYVARQFAEGRRGLLAV